MQTIRDTVYYHNIFHRKIQCRYFYDTVNLQEVFMYKTIYDTLEMTGRVKTAVFLTGTHKGGWCLVRNGNCESLLADSSSDIWTKYAPDILACEDTGILHLEDADIFVEIYVKNPQLVILGGGHVSRPVAKIGKMLGFHITVMDDRKEFLTKEIFPDADRLIEGAYEEIEEKIPVYENAYYVIVTRGHLGDSVCAREILKRPYAYLGMIGSRNKVKLTMKKLLEEGFSQKQLDTIHAPIGIPLGGQMPAEIAVSILAEITREKNKNQVSYIDEAVENAVEAGKHGVMITIVTKSGSSPRGIGSKMFLDSEGNSYGSIGGGNVEYQALLHAAESLNGEVVKYNLSNQGGANLGMICGGTVEVLFQRI